MHWKRHILKAHHSPRKSEAPELFNPGAREISTMLEVLA
jgi:hypothetical protein